MKAARITILTLLWLAYFGELSIGGGMFVREQNEKATGQRTAVRHIYVGTIEELDSLHLVVALQSEDKDLVRLISASNSAVLSGLKEGDRVIVEMDAQAMATKIVKTTTVP